MYEVDVYQERMSCENGGKQECISGGKDRRCALGSGVDPRIAVTNILQRSTKVNETGRNNDQ